MNEVFRVRLIRLKTPGMTSSSYFGKVGFCKFGTIHQFGRMCLALEFVVDYETFRLGLSVINVMFQTAFMGLKVLHKGILCGG